MQSIVQSRPLYGLTQCIPMSFSVGIDRSVMVGTVVELSTSLLVRVLVLLVLIPMNFFVGIGSTNNSSTCDDRSLLSWALLD